MSDSYVGEIRMFGGDFAPVGWHVCDGRLLPVSDYDALFALIGTAYGGDGQRTFGLPDLRGRVPVQMSNSMQLGATGGVETVTLIAQQLPAHTHVVNASTAAGSSNSPTNHVWASSDAIAPYQSAAPTVTMSPDAVAVTGGNQSHENVMPSLVVNFIICLYGNFPTG
ncbi:MAG: tail fiber protein [Pseudohongiella sp.]|uniref:phage tail protein n=1 Tax=Pseudohongiella sp. TaxID=1979412 RepID=UPI0034A0969E